MVTLRLQSPWHVFCCSPGLASLCWLHSLKRLLPSHSISLPPTFLFLSHVDKNDVCEYAKTFVWVGSAFCGHETHTETDRDWSNHAIKRGLKVPLCLAVVVPVVSSAWQPCGSRAQPPCWLLNWRCEVQANDSRMAEGIFQSRPSLLFLSWSHTQACHTLSHQLTLHISLYTFCRFIVSLLLIALHNQLWTKRGQHLWYS